MKIFSFLPHWVQDLLYALVGAVTTGFALRGFLVPNDFLDGGVTGVSLLLHELYHFNLGVVIIIANIPLVIAGGFQVNRKFALKTLASIIFLALCLEYMPYPVVTKDYLIAAVFGGFFLGLGIGLAMRAGCALDGIEVLALYTLKRSSFTVSEIILGLNVIIFLIAALHFGLQKALYAMLTYFIATRTIDYVIEGLEEFTGVTIISGKSQEIKEILVMKLGRGITVYKGERGFMKDSFDKSQECDIVFTIITRLEVRRLKNLVHEADPKAFVFTNTIKEAAGGVLSRTPKH
jgi:uncharacterized membrane-anchored protein YitT (DUF2179 family)